MVPEIPTTPPTTSSLSTYTLNHRCARTHASYAASEHETLLIRIVRVVTLLTDLRSGKEAHMEIAQRDVSD